MTKKTSKLAKIQKEIDSIKVSILNYNEKLKIMEEKEKEEISFEKNKLTTDISLEELKQAILLLEIEREREKEAGTKQSNDISKGDMATDKKIGGDNFDDNIK